MRRSGTLIVIAAAFDAQGRHGKFALLVAPRGRCTRVLRQLGGALRVLVHVRGHIRVFDGPHGFVLSVHKRQLMILCR